MAVHSIIFGHDLGQPAYLFTLSNEKGMQVSVTNYGATITKIVVPGILGETVQIACGFDQLSDYFSAEYTSENPYFGATIGRYANRIAGGRFQLDGTTFNLEKNFHDHHLHGGRQGFDKHFWHVSEVNNQKNELRLYRKSKHLEEGYPGNLEVEAIFRLSEENELSISYRGVTDQPTFVSLTNHTYFNLSGFKRDIENHRVRIDSKQYISMSESLDKNGAFKSVHQTAPDLRHGMAIKRVHRELGSGVDHFFVFDKSEQLKEVAEFLCPENGLTMKVLTNAPGAQFYTAAHLSDQLRRNEKERYGQMMAFCFECHEMPNGPNLNPVRGLLNPEDVYECQTVFKFPIQ